MSRVYLDHSATTPTHSEVVEAMSPYWQERFGNPSSIHTFGQEARKAVDGAREAAASLINADPSEIVFTSGGTEANNLALRGVVYASRRKGSHIITSSIEHSSILETCRYMKENGFRVTYLPVDKYGLVDPLDVEKEITSDTVLISIMYANNEVGTIEPLNEIGKIAREEGVCLHTDAVQAVGKMQINVQEIPADILTISAHKIYGPKGIGALYIRRGVKLAPLLLGGHHERNRRAGTENVPGIVGLGKACELAAKEMSQQYSRLEELRDVLEKKICSQIEGVGLNGHPKKRLPHILNLSFKSVEGEYKGRNRFYRGSIGGSGKKTEVPVARWGHDL